MSLDYRTPRQRKKPKNTEIPFAAFGEFTVQVYSKKHKKWLAVARRVNWSAAYEYALGYCAGVQKGVGYKNRSDHPYEAVWLVGPDGHGYACFEAPELP